MLNVNKTYGIKVVQSFQDPSDTSYTCLFKFVLCTENVKPGFALLRCVRQTPTLGTLNFLSCIQSVDGEKYLSSNMFVEVYLALVRYKGKGVDLFKRDFIKTARQGPSVETWSEDQDTSKSGTDKVFSIHCEFWPHDALEWTQRPREFGWPTARDISSIVDFGCHLVPVGHPRSDTKLMEWRISFSVAERTLVWTFNHIQMQCYAVMKIVLKEYIKEKCSEQNQVLCSYFIKTFLFWTFETTELDFWTKHNFRECINYLLADFADCIRKGVLKHYFLPKFNLLSVKLTVEAQTELLQLFDVIIKYDISILKYCNTLRNVWSKFLSAHENQMHIINNSRRLSFLNDDELMMLELIELNLCIDYAHARHQDFLRFHGISTHSKSYWFSLEQLLTIPCKSHLKSFLTKQLLLEKHVRSLVELNNSENRELHILVDNCPEACDLSSNNLWYGILLLKKGDYTSTLRIINQVLSFIPPFALHDGYFQGNVDIHESKRLYADKFLNSPCITIQRAKEAWLMPFLIPKCVNEMLPLAFQIEQHFVNNNTIRLYISPIISAYYISFQCYHELGQYDNRDRALQQLINNMDTVAQRFYELAYVYRSFNIAGHCLLITGEIDQACEVFSKSRAMTKRHRAEDKQNSAHWYIANFCSASHR